MFCDINSDGQVDETEIIQEDHYYPFGMRHEGYGRTVAAQGENFYQYNGKELNEDFGLDWYSYGFRNYDAAIGRFPSCDPIAEEFAFVSPYNYAENRVPNAIDLWGLQAYVVNEHYDKKGNLTSISVKTHTNDEGETLDNGKSQLLDGTPMSNVLVRKHTYNDEGKKDISETTSESLTDEQQYTYQNGTQTQNISDGFDESDGFAKLGDVTLNESRGYFRKTGYMFSSTTNINLNGQILNKINNKIGKNETPIKSDIIYSNSDLMQDRQGADATAVQRSFPTLMNAPNTSVDLDRLGKSGSQTLRVNSNTGRINAIGVSVLLFSNTLPDRA